LRYDCDISGEFNCTSYIRWGNTYHDDGRTNTLTFLDETVFNCDLLYIQSKASATGVLDLTTNSVAVGLAGDVDFVTGFSAGTLTVNNVSGVFNITGSANQTILCPDTDISTVVLNKSAGDVTFIDTVADLSGISNGEVIIQ